MNSVQAAGGYLIRDGLGRFIPEPRVRGVNFANILRGVGNLFASDTNSLGIQPEYQELLEKQIEVQEQMQILSMASNIEKSKHETQMTAIRNIRIG